MKLKRKIPSLEIQKNIYQFNDFEDICHFVKNRNIKSIRDDVLYSMNEKYYLKVVNMPYKDIVEYANISNEPELLEAKLKEYGKIIIEKNALKTIQKFFAKK